MVNAFKGAVQIPGGMFGVPQTKVPVQSKQEPAAPHHPAQGPRSNIGKPAKTCG